MSTIWDLYERIQGKKGSARCLLCNNEYSFKNTSSNLKKHLMYKHFSEYQSLLNKEKLNPVIIKTESVLENKQFSNVTQETENLSSSLEQAYTPEKEKRKKKSVKRVIQRYSSSESGHLSDLQNTSRLQKEQKKQIDKKLLDMIIQDYQSVSVVDDKGFQGLVRALNPNYELPSRKLISKKIIPEQFIKCKALVMNLIQKAQYICITIDCWTTRIIDTYISVTAHFMLDLKLQHVLLHCEYISGSHSADALAVILQNVARDYNIEDKITLAVSDNAPNIRKALEKNQWPYFSCFAQKLNIIIEEALGIIHNVVETVKNVVVFFKKDSFALKALLKYQIDCERKTQALPLIQFVPTRWNTVFYMLERFLKLQGALQAVIPTLKTELPILSTEIWDSIKQICLILQPFEEAIRVISCTEYLSASLVIVLVDGLKNVISLMKDKPIIGCARTFLDKLDDGLKTHFPDQEVEDNMLLGVCTLIDPRFKVHAFLDHSMVKTSPSGQTCQRQRRAHSITEHVIELVKYKIRDKQQNMLNSSITLNTTSVAELDSLSLRRKTDENINAVASSFDIESEKLSVWGKIDKNIAAVTPCFDVISTKARNEVEMFFNEEIASRDSCPLTWWKNHELIYPNLVDIFMDHCHIVVTSVESEKAFTKSRSRLTENRACLGRKHTAELVFLHGNHIHFQ